jgi:hypothetical protein
VPVSELLVAAGPGAVWDLGVGLVEAYATASSSEPDPAVRSATQARREALHGLREAVLSLPLRDGVTIADLAPDRLEPLLRALERAPIVGEWREPASGVTAAARATLYEGADAVLPLVCGLEPGSEDPSDARDARAALPFLIITLSDDAVLRPALTPQVRLTGGTAAFEDPVPVLKTAEAPFTYFRSRDEALRALPDGAHAVEVPGSAAGEAHIDLALGEDAAQQLGRLHLEPTFACFRAVLVVAPGLDLRMGE